MDFGERHPGIDSVVSVVDKPIQWAMGGIQLVLAALFLIGCCIFVPIYGYLRGPANRADAVAYFSSTGDYDPEYNNDRSMAGVKDNTTIYTIDYTHPSVMAERTKSDGTVVSELPAYLEYDTINGSDSHWVATPFPFTSSTDNYGNRFAPNPGCDRAIRQRYMSPNSWWSFWANEGNFDRLRWAEDKQAPMYAAYVRAAYTSWALQHTIVKLRHSDTALTGKWSSNFCKTPVDASIMMPGAPVIKMAFVDGTKGLGSAGHLEYPEFLLFGMCLASECRDEAFEYNLDRDMFSDPSVNEYQQHAIDAMDAMQSDEFWLKVAHANGVVGKDIFVKLHAGANRDEIKHLLVDSTSQTGDTNYTYKNYALSVRNAILFGYLPVFVALIIVWRLVKKMIREHREEQWRKHRERFIPVEVIPPPQRQQPQPQQPRFRNNSGNNVWNR
jgi:hypothetical protein